MVPFGHKQACLTIIGFHANAPVRFRGFQCSSKQQVIEAAAVGCRSHLQQSSPQFKVNLYEMQSLILLPLHMILLSVFCGPMQAQLGSRVFSAWKTLQAKLLTIRLWKSAIQQNAESEKEACAALSSNGLFCTGYKTIRLMTEQQNKPSFIPNEQMALS